MKKVIKMLIFAGLLFIPYIVFAAGGVSANTSSLSMEQGGTATFTITASNAAGKVTINSNNTGVATVSTGAEWVENNSVTVTVTGVTPGTTTISVGIACATFDEEPINRTDTITVNVAAPKSGNNDLSSITINGAPISGFSASNTNYNLGSTDADSITIGATAADSKAYISGTGYKGLNYGANNATISVRAENGNVKNYVINIYRNDNRSNNNYLSSLSLSQGSINFNKNTTSYSVTVENSVSSINISAQAEDGKSKISGTGSKSLRVYGNTFDVTVTAENGSTKRYRINVIRKDEQGNTTDSNQGGNANNSELKELAVEGYSIGFNPSVTEYTLEVGSGVETVTINAIANSDKAKVEGLGVVQLNPGINEFKITVTSESGDYTDYFIKIDRKDEANVPSTVLTELSFNGTVIDVNTDARTFLIGVDAGISSLDLKYKTASSKSNFEVKGNDNLKEGINVVTIKVTDQGADDTVYTLVVNKFGNDSFVNSLAIDKFTGNTSFNSTEIVKIKKSLIDELKKTDYKFNYNFVNKYNGLLYSVQFDKNVKINEDVELDISKIGTYEKSVVYSSNVPENALVNLHVDDSLKGKSVYLYSYNMETKKYILIKSNEKIDNEYISFKSDGSYIYFLSEKKITDKSFIFQLILYLLFFALGAIIVITVLVFKKRKELMGDVKKRSV